MESPRTRLERQAAEKALGRDKQTILAVHPLSHDEGFRGIHVRLMPSRRLI